MNRSITHARAQRRQGKIIKRASVIWLGLFLSLLIAPSRPAQEVADTIRVRTDGGRALLDGMPGVDRVVDQGNHQEVRVKGDPQAFLKALVARTTVHQFEITRPSLHDIFVRIAQPEAAS